MKKNFYFKTTFLTMILSLFFVASSYSQTTVTWALTADTTVDVSSGTGFSALGQVTSDRMTTVRYDKTFASVTTQHSRTDETPSCIPYDYADDLYFEYAVNAETGYNVSISNVAMAVGATVDNFYVKVAASTDDFATSTVLGESAQLSTSAFTDLSYDVTTSVSEATSYKVRVYPKMEDTRTGKYMVINNVKITFTAEVANVDPGEEGPTLKHSYTFETADTVIDVVGNVGGNLEGTATIENGALVLDANGDYVSFDGAALDLNSYEAITMEYYFTGSAAANTAWNWSSYFGDANGSNNLRTSLGHWNDEIRVVYSGSEILLDGQDVNDGFLHQIVTVLTADSLFYYEDGTLRKEQ